MMVQRVITGLFAAILLIWAGSADASGKSGKKELLPKVEPNEEGVYVQPWFYESFLDLREDIGDSAKQGKQLAIFWEQRGCPYCREMHHVNLRRPEIVDYIRKNFNVIQMNLWGDREVTDVDGEATTEKKLARKYKVQFTPTIQFFPPGVDANSKKPGHDVEVWRLLGYWKPFHFLNSFVYVKDKGYESEPNFQRWLQALARKMEAEGKEVELW